MFASIVLYAVAAYYFFKLYRVNYKFNQMVISFLHLVIPDIILFINYMPVYFASITRGALIDSSSTWCQASGFMMCASICASNIGAVAIAITTKRCLDFNDRKVDNKFQCMWGAAGWLVGIGLSVYYSAANQLGDYKTLYCGARDNTRYDVSIPVFAVFAGCVTVMMYYYRRAWYQVSNTVAVSKSTPASTPVDNRAERIISTFGMKMCIAYYLSWAPVSIVAMLDTGKYTAYPLYLDIAAGWCIKCGCFATAYIVYSLMRNIYDATQERISYFNQPRAISIPRDRENNGGKRFTLTAGEDGRVA